jgi:hypothetical protein
MTKSERMAHYVNRYNALKAELQLIGFIFQGSIHTRSAECGTPTCRCHQIPEKRHGPYHYWTRKAKGKTVALMLTEEEFPLYREWIQNNRKLQRLVRQMRALSARALALRTGRKAP